MNNKISGVYHLQTLENIGSYELAGNDRAAVTENEDIFTDWVSLSNGTENDRIILLCTKNKLNIKKIRVLPLGGDGLRTTQNAAVLGLCFTTVGDDKEKIGFGPYIEVSRFGEWQDVDVSLEPYKLFKDEFYLLGFSLAKFSVDDYNIIDEYIGQTVNFKVEVIANTAGIKRGDNII